MIDDVLARMEQDIAALPENMAAELTTWQAADMHRKDPFTVLHDNVAQTSIFPPRTDKKPTPRLRSLRRRMREQHAAEPKPARPVLRAVLRKKLADRMANLLGMLTWHR